MDKSLIALCNAIKAIIQQLKPQGNTLSFLLLIGKDNQGKKSLLRQSNLTQVRVEAERSTDVYYNDAGLIVRLSESWVTGSHCLLQQIIKQLNRCHHSLQISGLLLCIDINELFFSEHLQYLDRCKAHIQLLNRFGLAIGYQVDVAIMLTKFDSLAGFCEFFQQSHATELEKALGFSLYRASKPERRIEIYNKQFHRMVNILEQQVIQKMHPVRSSLRRTLIREFPLQLISLQKALQIIVQNIPDSLFNLQAVYFSSAEQGGYSQDRLNKRIKHEYALAIQDQFLQAKNYRAYFIHGAITAFQRQTQRSIESRFQKPHLVISSICGLFLLPLSWIAVNHIKTSQLLDAASKELLTYEALISDKQVPSPALYHLARASASLDNLPINAALPSLHFLKTQLQTNARHQLHSHFLPAILNEIEQSLTDRSETPGNRYQALKIYLMLNHPHKLSLQAVQNWFKLRWQKEPEPEVQKKLALLKQLLKQPVQPVAINLQLVRDMRNYLNALPDSYLYYSLAKTYFPKEKEKITVEGFELAHHELPAYFTRHGFETVIALLPQISAELDSEQWVLERDKKENIQISIQKAYCYEYVSWWKNLMNRSTPWHFQDYQQAQHLTQTLTRTNAVKQFIELIQQQTSPDFAHQDSLFNQEIASQFTSLNLLGKSAVQELSTHLNELENFLKTLSVVQDHGQTAFTLTKAQFQGNTLPNPLSALYVRSQQFPEPVNNWLKQIADDSWFILMQETRAYINEQWQKQVFAEYLQHIAQRYPFESTESQEVNIADFDHFFAADGTLNQFVEYYLKPFLDTTSAQWQPKEYNHSVLPISQDNIHQLIHSNVITNMFFSGSGRKSKIDFSLQKISLDPVVSQLELQIGNNKISDDQYSDSFVRFSWPVQDVKLILNSIEGSRFEIEESGQWAFFKLLQKVNVLTDEEDSANLQILFEVNGNSGRYLLKVANKVNPFTPGILHGFALPEKIT